MNDHITEAPASWRFHHLGVACRSIEKESTIWFDLGYQQEGLVFIDQNQGIKGMFLTGAGPRLELLEDLPNRKTVAPWLEKSVKIYHIAFEVKDIDKEIDRLVQRRARVVVHPIASVAFDNRRICFLMLNNFSLIELIEVD